MEQVEVNGKVVDFKNSPYNAKNNISSYRIKLTEALNKLGIEDRYIEVSFGGGSGYREPSWAKVTWYVNGQEHSYKCNSQQRDVDNLAAIAQVIEQDSKTVRRGMKSFGQVMTQFRIGFDPEADKQKTAREIIGVPPDTYDLEYIKFKYRQKAKQLHSDAGGDDSKMKELNEAYENLKKEIEKK